MQTIIPTVNPLTLHNGTNQNEPKKGPVSVPLMPMTSWNPFADAMAAKRMVVMWRRNCLY